MVGKVTFFSKNTNMQIKEIGYTKAPEISLGRSPVVASFLSLTFWSNMSLTSTFFKLPFLGGFLLGPLKTEFSETKQNKQPKQPLFSNRTRMLEILD